VLTFYCNVICNNFNLNSFYFIFLQVQLNWFQIMDRAREEAARAAKEAAAAAEAGASGTAFNSSAEAVTSQPEPPLASPES
jgi:hypothetical protein